MIAFCFKRIFSGNKIALLSHMNSPNKRKGGSMKSFIQPVKREKEAKIISKKKEYFGLCSSCKTASSCTYLRDLKRPVLQCEEFEGYESRIVKTTVKNILLKTNPKFGSGNEERDLRKYPGLCSICEDRETCTFPKPEGGVWRCEEYR